MITLKKIHAFTERSGQSAVILAIALYTLAFSFFCLWKYYNFAYNALDLAIISQVFYNSSLGNFFASSIHPPTYLGDHFSPILFLLLPVYWLFKKPEALLVLQTLALGLSSWPLYLIAKKSLGKPLAIFFALAWLLNPFVQNINLYEFSFLPFSVFFIFWTFYFYQAEKIFVFLFFCFFVLLTREDAALVIFALGPLAFLQKRKLRWWLWPMVLSALYFILAVKITMFFTPGGQYKFLIYYGWLGNGFNDILTHLIFQPGLLLAPLFQPGNWEFFLGLMLPLVFLPLLSPVYLLLGAGVFFQLILRAGGASGTLLQMSYASLLLPAVFIAAIFGLKKITGAEKGIYLSSDRSRPVATRQLGFLILIAGLIYSCLTLGPISGIFYKIYQTGLYSSSSAAKQELLNQIPVQAAVAAGYEFLAPLSSRQNLYSFNYAFLGKQQYLAADYSLPPETEYLLLDYDDLIGYQLQYGFNPFYQKQYQAAIQAWPKNLAGFGLIDFRDTAALYQKGAADRFTLIKTLCGNREPLFGSREPLLPTENSGCEELPAEKEITELASDVSFAGFNRVGGEYQLFWQINFPLKEIYRLKLTASDGQKIIYQKIYPFAWDLLADQSLSGKKNIQANYWLGLPPGDYELKIQLLKLGGGGIELDPIRSTANIIDQEIPVGPEINLELIADR